MKTFIKLLSIAICLSSCELITPKPKMFSCKVNGKLWTPEISGPIGSRYTGNAFYRTKNGFFDVYGSSDDCFISISIKINPNSKIELNKKYPMVAVIELDKASGSFGVYSKIDSNNKIYSKSKTGFIEITAIDGQYFSGTFEYDLEKEIESKKYKIRNGQFNNMLYAKDDN